MFFFFSFFCQQDTNAVGWCEQMGKVCTLMLARQISLITLVRELLVMTHMINVSANPKVVLLQKSKNSQYVWLHLSFFSWVMPHAWHSGQNKSSVQFLNFSLRWPHGCRLGNSKERHTLWHRIQFSYLILSACLVVGPLLWARPKRLNNYLMDCCKALCSMLACGH